MKAHPGDAVKLMVDGSLDGDVEFSIYVIQDGARAATPIAKVDGKAQKGHAEATWTVDVKDTKLPCELEFEALRGKSRSFSSRLTVAALDQIGPLVLNEFVGPTEYECVFLRQVIPIAAEINESPPVEIELFLDAVDAQRQATELASLDKTTTSGLYEFKTWAVPAGNSFLQLRLEIRGKQPRTRRSALLVVFNWAQVDLVEPSDIDKVAHEGNARPIFTFEPKKTPTVTPGGSRARWDENTVHVFAPPLEKVVKLTPLATNMVMVAFPERADAKPEIVLRNFHGVIWCDRHVEDNKTKLRQRFPVKAQAKNTFTLESRLRLSAWMNPRMFLDGGTFKKDTLKPAKGLDDFVLLDFFDVLPTATKKFPLKHSEFTGLLGRIVEEAHKNKIQVLPGYSAIIQDSQTHTDNPLLAWLNDNSRKEDEIDQLAADLVGSFSGIAIDGLDFDIEHITTSQGNWPTTLQANLNHFFKAVCNELVRNDQILSIAGAPFDAPGMVVSPNVPAVGSGPAMPFEMASLSPNLLLRPMAFDNGLLLEQLRSYHDKVCRYAYKAGVHHSQFQIGIKNGQGTNNAEGGLVAGGFVDYPVGLVETCKRVLRKLRVGLSIFSFGDNGPPFWPFLEQIDKAMNPVGPPPGTHGQPLQGPILGKAADRLSITKVEGEDDSDR